jgi:aspartyl-tRNA(Asn)/glutamyl-tRNA(Gln) amidotransferase subunit A
MPSIAFRLGEKSDPLSMYLADILTVPANLAGIPAISVPCGKAVQKMPVGLQIMGKPLKMNVLSMLHMLTNRR